MSTLYDILGLSRQATAEQIENGYKVRLQALQRGEENVLTEDSLAQLKAIREAYQVLSNPVRREAYDRKLDARVQVQYEVVEDGHSFRNMILALLIVLIIGAGYAYKVQLDNKERRAQLEIEAAREKAKAEEAERLAAAEQARLEQAQLRKAQIDEQRQRYETEQARREGQQIHQQLEFAKVKAAREKELAERREQYEKQREEQLARARVANENAAMQRALNIPIRRY